MSCSIELYKHQQDALTKSEKFNNVAYWHDGMVSRNYKPNNNYW